LVAHVIVAEVPAAAGVAVTPVMVGGVVSVVGVTKLAGGFAGTGEVASLVAASVDRTRKK
jgi:hypothetical protein